MTAPFIGFFSGNATPNTAGAAALLGQPPVHGLDFLSYNTFDGMKTDLLWLLTGWVGSPSGMQPCFSVPLTMAGITLQQIAGGSVGICASQAVTAGGNLLINGSLATSGVATLDGGIATVTATTSGGAVTALLFTPGSGFQPAVASQGSATYPLTFVGSCTNSATGTYTVTAGAISSTMLTYGGTGYANTPAVYAATGAAVCIASTGNDSARTFTITGTNFLGATVTKIITGLNASSGYTDTFILDQYLKVTSVSVDAPCVGNISVGPAYATQNNNYAPITLTSDQAFADVAATIYAAFPTAIIRLGWEPNVPNLAPWCATGGSGRNSYTQFNYAWNRVAPCFRSLGFKVMWCPALAQEAGVNTTNFWPGFTNVDIIGGDFYFRNYSASNLTPAEAWSSALCNANGPTWWITYASGKQLPTMLCEVATGYAPDDSGMGDTPYFVNELYSWMVANSVEGICGWWNQGINSEYDGTVYGSMVSNPQTAIAINQNFGNNTATTIANVSPGGVSVTWASGFAGGVIPVGTAAGTVVGQLSATASAAIGCQYRNWTTTSLITIINYGANAGQIVTAKKAVATAAASQTISVQNAIAMVMGSMTVSAQ